MVCERTVMSHGVLGQQRVKKLSEYSTIEFLTHWGRVTHICVGNLTIFDSNNGLWPGRRQAITWTNAGLLLIRPWGTHFYEILIGIQTFSFKKTHLKMSSAKWRPFCLGLNVFITTPGTLCQDTQILNRGTCLQGYHLLSACQSSEFV